MHVVVDMFIVSYMFYISGSVSVLTFILLLFSQSSNGQPFVSLHVTLLFKRLPLAVH